MPDENDELLNEYLTESREHLATIENDLLGIEERGADIDEVLVNKVFRAAHSIKGGAGFMNLSIIQQLAHKVENVLDMVRSREMVPTPEVVSVLLRAFDRLRELINNPAASQQADISESVAMLTGLATAHLPDQQKDSLIKMAEIPVPGTRRIIKIPEFDLVHARQGGNYVYLAEYDLIHDIHRHAKTPLEVFDSLIMCGTILDCQMDLESAGTLDDPPSNELRLCLLYATTYEPAMIRELVEVPENRVHLVFDRIAPGAASAPVPAAPAPVASAPKPAAPPPRPAAKPEPPAVTAPAPKPKTTEALPSADEAPLPAPGAKAAPTGAPVAETSLRVNISLLESLMNLAGELVLSRNQLNEAISKGDSRSILAGSQRINLVTSELQETIMLTRMQPIGNVFAKFPRVVRDMAKELGKEIQLELSGKDVEMDKTIVEGLSDPLTHMVRNACDHGLETREKRIQQGKKALGTMWLKAYHEAGQIVVEIGDDGKGINTQKVADAAVARGQITQEQAKAMSEKERMALIFLPGLSTAEKVTDVSGRGVGMDVVKTNLDRLGGKVEIDSELGKGTVFRIKLPLTLAIIPSLLVSAGGERFAIPQVNVSELIRLSAEQMGKRIEVVGDTEVLVLRGELIPLLQLADVLGIPRTYVDPKDGLEKPDRRRRLADRRSDKHPLFGTASPSGNGASPRADDKNDRGESGRRFHAESAVNIVIVSAGIFQFGLVVEKLHDTVEIVVKPLGRHLKKLREYAGATIMGDGRVALILDVSGMAAMAGLSSLAGTTRAEELAKEHLREAGADVQSLLLFRNAPEECCAMPLGLVARVEQITTGQIEMMGGRRTMQYRGATLPLVALQDAAKVAGINPEQPQVVIVFNSSGREMGLVAARPVDVIETAVTVDSSTLKQRGLMGSAIVRGHTTLLVDVFDLVEAAYPEWAVAPPPKTAQQAATILLAEDSDFFRGQVKKFIESSGYKVIAAADGQEAWDQLCQHPGEVRLVVTDIEMPRMSGLELATRIRGDSRFSGLPIIAVSSLAGDEDVARGAAAGVTQYHIKLDKQNLLGGIQQLLANATEER